MVIVKKNKPSRQQRGAYQYERESANPPAKARASESAERADPQHSPVKRATSKPARHNREGEALLVSETDAGMR